VSRIQNETEMNITYQLNIRVKLIKIIGHKNEHKICIICITGLLLILYIYKPITYFLIANLSLYSQD
jgi:hypothetical protein